LLQGRVKEHRQGKLRQHLLQCGRSSATLLLFLDANYWSALHDAGRTDAKGTADA
jgi:hypothetical protein